MRILFAGTPSCSIPALKMLSQNFELCAVLTNPPAPVGRSKKLIPSDVELATRELIEKGILSNNFPIFTPHKLDAQFRNELSKLNLDLLVCFAYGKIFGPKTMAQFKMGGINIHPSLLPRWRGATPIPAAILAGDEFTGITIQTLVAKADAGNILISEKIKIKDTDTSESLLERCASICCPLLNSILSNFENAYKNAKPQNENEATYSSILKKEDGLIDWTCSAKNIEQRIRAFSPWPGCFSFIDGEKINIVQATVYKKQIQVSPQAGMIIGSDKECGILVQTGDGVLAITVLQKQGKNKLFWKDFLNGNKTFLEKTFSLQE